MTCRELLTLITLLALAVVLASALTFALFPESVVVPTSPSGPPAAPAGPVPVPVRLPFAGGRT